MPIDTLPITVFGALTAIIARKERAEGQTLWAGYLNLSDEPCIDLLILDGGAERALVVSNPLSDRYD